MNKDSVSILQNFSRKLANCQRSEKVNVLLDYLKEGKFGYTVDGETVVANDFVLADDLALVINQIRAIIKAPHIFLKKEPTVTHVSLATNVDTESLLKTYADDKLWNVKGDTITPEYVHTNVNEDTYAIYENRFITELIDLLYNDVSKRLSILLDGLKTLNSLAGKNLLEKGFNTQDYFSVVDNFNGEIPVIASSTGADTKTISLLIKCKKQLAYLKQTPFYTSCKKAGKFDITLVKATNIFNMDKKYNYCFKFYNSYVNATNNKDNDFAYVNFIALNFLKSIINCGFTLDDSEQEVIISRTQNLVFDNISFTLEPFTIKVKKEENSNSLIVTTGLTSDNSTTTYKIDIIDEEKFNSLNLKSINDYFKGDLEVDSQKSFVINSFEKSDNKNTLYILPNEIDTAKKLALLVKSLFMVCEVSIAIHSRICPICGSSLIAPEDSDVVCSTCEGKYHLYSYGVKEYALIKNLPLGNNLPIYNEGEPSEKVEVVESKPIVDEDDIIEEVKNIEEPTLATVVVNKTYINKSFTAKLIQSTDDVKVFYNDIRNYILSYKGVNGRISWQYDSFNLGRKQMAKLIIRGKTLSLCLALNPSELEDKYFAKDFGDVKKFEDVPAVVKIKSTRGVMFAKQLIDKLFEGVDKKEDFVPETYKFKYLTDKTLIKNGLAKVKDFNM